MVAIFTGLGAGFERGSRAALGSAGLLGSGVQGRAGEGVSLNASTGNLILTQQDEFLAGLGPDVGIGRTYNSLLGSGLDDNGDQWRQSTDRRIYGLTGTVNTSGSKITRISANGSAIEYSYNTTSGVYSTTDGAGAYDTLSYASGSDSWTWTDGTTQMTETYGVSVGDSVTIAQHASGLNSSSLWRIQKQADTDGNALIFTYTTGAYDKLDTITTQNGEYIKYTWTGGDITKVETNFGTGNATKLTRVYYGYDTSQSVHRLTSVTVDLSPDDNDPNSTGGSYTTTYAYVGTTNYISSIHQSDGSWLVIGYDGSNRVTSLVQYDGSATLTSEAQVLASGNTRRTEIAYGANQTSIKVYRQEYVDSSTPSDTTTLYYNAAGQLTQVTAPPAYTGATPQTVMYAYDPNGNVTLVTDPTGATTTYTYDANGNVASITDGVGNVVTRSYDAKNALVLETRTASTDTSSAQSLYTRYVYDGEDHLRFTISNAGRVTEYQYWANGSSSDGSLKYKIDYVGTAGTADTFYTTIAPPTLPTEAQMMTWVSSLDRTNSEICKYVYDARGDLSQSTHYGASSSTGVEATTEGYDQTVYVYDQAGRLRQRTQGPLSTESFAYDGLGRLISSSDLNGGTTTIVFNDAATTTTVTTAAGLTTVSTYNKAGDLLSSLVSGTNTTGGTEYFAYDKNGEVRRSIDATGKIHYFLYDKVGRKMADIGQGGEVVEYKYDKDNRLIASVRYTNTLSTTELNAIVASPTGEFEFGVNLTRPTPNSADLWSWTIYDAGGRVVETIAGDGAATRYEYDNSNQLVKTTSFATKLAVSGLITTTPTSPTWPTGAANDRITRNFYSTDGLLIGSLNAQGFFTRIFYDSAWRKFQEISYANAPAGSPATDSMATIVANITADATKDISTRYVYDGQGLLRFTIDALNRVTELVYRQSDDGYAIGVARKTIQYANTLGTVANYNYLTIKAAVAGIASSANDRVSYAVYNTHGQLAYAIDATGAVAAFAYDIMGRVTKTTQYATLNTTGLGAVADSSWLSTMDTWAGTQASNASNRITRTWYSERGDVRYVVDAEGYVTQNDVDAEGRLVGQHRYGNVVQINGQPVSDTTTIGQIASANKGTDAAVTYAFDAFGRVSDITDQLNTHTTRAYYANGLLQDEIVAPGAGAESKTRRTYDQAGHLLTVTVGFGATEAATTTYAYDGLGNVSSVTDARGNATTFTYDKLGRVLTKTDPLGGRTTYVYDGFGNVVSTTDARGSIWFAYYDQAGRATLNVDALGYATETSYTAFSEVASVTRRYIVTTGATVAVKPTITADSSHDETTSFGYDKLGRLVSVTPPIGPATQYLLNAFGQVVQTTDPLGNASYVYYDHLGQATLSIDAEGYATERTFNARGQVATEIRRAVRATGLGDVNVRPTITTNALDGTTSYAYDAAGRPTDQTSPVGIVTHYDYDLRGNRTKMTEAYGLAEHRITTYQYDKLNRLTDVIGDAVYFANSATAALSGTTVNPTTHYDYDANGNVIAVTDPMLSKTLSWYDSRNLLIEQVGPPNAATNLSTVTKYTYDADGNVTEKRVLATQIDQSSTTPATVPSVDNSVGDRIIQYTYDTLNHVKQVTIPNIEIASYGTGFAVSTPASGLVTTTQYDAMGNVVKVTDANGNTTWSYYDKLNRKIAQFDGLNYRTDWTYDADGNVLSETRYASQATGTNAPTNVSTLPAAPAADVVNDRVTTFTYDKMARRLTETRANVLVNNAASPGTTTNVSSVVAYTYNALGEVLSKTEATGDAIVYVYDAAGRMTSESRSAFTDVNGASVTPTINYAYDGLGDLISKTDMGAGGAIAASNRITTYAYGAGGRLSSVTDASGFVHTYQHDAAGRVTRDEYTRTTPVGSVHEAQGYDYDLEGRVIRQGVVVDTGNTNTWSRTGTNIDTVAMAYNAFGEVAQRGYFHDISGVQTTLYDETFAYDGAGRLWSTTAGDGTAKYFMYDAAGNQTLLVQSTGTDIFNKANIDAVLDLWGATRANVGTTYVAGVIATITRYDARNQAIEAKEPQRELNSTTRNDLSTTRAYNAFGDVIYEINALGNRIDYSYNTMGRLTQTQSPAVSITSEAGAITTNYRPTEYRYYDASGRLVATRDANSNLTQYSLLAGTGYGGSSALLTQTKTADNATVVTGYDIHGDARKVTDQIGRITLQDFDSMDRLTKLTHPGAGTGWSGGLIDYYGYDGLGQRIKHANNYFNSTISSDPHYNASFNAADMTTWANPENTVYDQQGRVISQSQFGGDAITYTYAWDGSIATTGLASFGGWSKTSNFVFYRTIVEKADAFNRTVQLTDLSTATTSFTFDKAGRVITSTGGQTVNYSYFNTGRASSIYGWLYGSLTIHTGGEYRTQTFGYDGLGQSVSERIDDSVTTWTKSGTEWIDTTVNRVLENSTATFDALGRLTNWAEVGSTDMPVASLSYAYDANGNIRRSLASYRTLNSQGVASTTATTQDYWFKYDQLNRVITSKGTQSGGAIVRGTTGMDLSYDSASQRVQSLSTSGSQTRREDYTYDADGSLDHVYYATGTGLPTQGPLVADFTYDLMGRLTAQYDYNGTGALQYSRVATFNDKSQITTDTTVTLHSSTLYKAVNTYDYGVIGTSQANTTYMLGNPLSVGTVNYEASTSTPNTWVQKKSTLLSTIYGVIDRPIASSVSYDSDTSTTTNPIFTTNYFYTRFAGRTELYKATISDGRPRTVTFASDWQSHVLRRDEADGNASTGDPHELWYRFSGRQIGYVGNNGTIDLDYSNSDADRTAVAGTGAFHNGSGTSTSYADFDQSIAHIDSYYQGSLAGTYTAQGGETLSSLASQLWGDSSLWYKLASANGFSDDVVLDAGTIVQVPPGVMRSSNTAATFTPYDPNSIVGSTLPTTPLPPKSKNGCGIAQIILVVIAIAVVAVLHAPITNLLAFGSTTAPVVAGAAVAPGLAATVGGYAAAGAVGSIASQSVGVATGIQDKFSWNAVALAAIGAGVAGGLGYGGPLAGNGAVAAAERAVVGDIITQGIGVATGLQDKFSWAGVAAAAVGGYVGARVGIATQGLGSTASKIIATTAADIADAATRSIVDGSDFGDNMLAALPDILGNALWDIATASPNVSLTAATPENAKPFDKFKDNRNVVAADQTGVDEPNYYSGSFEEGPNMQAATPWEIAHGTVIPGPLPTYRSEDVAPVIVTGRRRDTVTEADMAVARANRDARRAQQQAQRQAEVQTALAQQATVGHELTDQLIAVGGAQVVQSIPVVGDAFNIYTAIRNPTAENVATAAFGLAAPALAHVGVGAASILLRRGMHALEEARSGARTAEQIVEDVRPPPLGPTNAHLADLPIHPDPTRAYARADELLQPENISRLHPTNDLQRLGGEQLGRGGVRDLSNEELLTWGGTSGDDPIAISRRYGAGDSRVYPGAQIQIQAGHHRLEEVVRRIENGTLPPDALIEVRRAEWVWD